MKRDEALAPLSHDHHEALYRALRLRRATGEDAAAVREDVLSFWSERGARHFRIEEEILLPGCAHRVDPASAAVAQVLTDHVWIRARIDRLEAGRLDLDQMRELGERLDAHIRHEERVLFPMIEESVDPAELGALGAAIEDAERS